YLWYEERAREALSRPRPDYAQQLEDTLLFGSPARVRAQLSRFREESGFANLICMTSYGGQPTDQVMRSMRLFAEEVMPHSRYVGGGRGCGGVRGDRVAAHPRPRLA